MHLRLLQKSDCQTVSELNINHHEEYQSQISLPKQNIANNVESNYDKHARRIW